MCRTKEGKRILTSRAYRYKWGHDYQTIKCKNELRNEIVIDLVNNGGSIKIAIYDQDKNELKVFDNPSTGTYRFTMEVGKRYLIHGVFDKAIGSYRISV